MNCAELLRLESEEAFRELLSAIDGISEAESWFVFSATDALHTNASVSGIVEHVATCKLMYASAAFTNNEFSWRDCANRLDELNQDWARIKEFLNESQEYWLRSWRNFDDAQLEEERHTNWGELWPAWRIVSSMSHHDSYHAGQINLMRQSLSTANERPASTAEDIRRILI